MSIVILTLRGKAERALVELYGFGGFRAISLNGGRIHSRRNDNARHQAFDARLHAQHILDYQRTVRILFRETHEYFSMRLQSYFYDYQRVDRLTGGPASLGRLIRAVQFA